LFLFDQISEKKKVWVILLKQNVFCAQRHERHEDARRDNIIIQS